MTDAPDPQEVLRDFRQAVNMDAAALREWLGTEESREVGFVHEGESESVGHEMGRHIVQLLQHPPKSPSEEQVAQMRKVVGYVHRHMAQRPEGDVEHTRWRYSLMNWGHDPLKRDSKAHR